ncbi:DUF1294 domain-containing protein [Undibacterium sp. SXout20W]|uniref:DUF1294 domain-containing protein n=1 Tax=Undibacterium sp. SXout20W TaxID=3413051 RepID=UPI003BF30B4D
MDDFSFIGKILAAYYVLVSFLCFLCYRSDKYAARAHRRRIPEWHLLIWSLLGGWPGALIAHRFLRHKSSKSIYLLKFWLIVILHLSLVAGSVWLYFFGLT